MGKKNVFLILLVLGVVSSCCGCRKKKEENINEEITNKETNELRDGFDYWKSRNICSYKQINKIVVKVNESIDTSWISIPDVDIIDEDKIKYFYEKVGEMKIGEKKGDDIELEECEKVKERDIYIYDEYGNYNVIHYNPLTKDMVAFVDSVDEDENYVRFKSGYDEFDNWLITNLKIDINKDYLETYNREKTINSCIAMVQNFNNEKWYGGYSQEIVDDKLYLIIYMKDEKEKYKANIEKIIDKDLIIYKKSKYSVEELKAISDKINNILMENEDVNNVSVDGCKIVIEVNDTITANKKEELKDALKEYSDIIDIVYAEKHVLE
ncbi:hypothetical protein SAMN02745111_02080 [Eubacterium uniforme]|uniref:Lipoprotein n=1 Tax=Eubacterium uniforme TaxID=39495 RepID=A0A1T4W0F7_9FIRM|nr:hypothetical protein [Eubacterium uniforme]SKA70687.1 hypothetical protein SAMN02745111_02080 [Eubacterium uniforme]